MDGDVLEHIAADDADRMLGDGVFEGGIVPKLEAAVVARRGGVDGSIGATGSSHDASRARSASVVCGT